MEVPDTQVAVCIDAGLGNIGNSGPNDDFLSGGGTALGYAGAGEGTFDSDAGTWAFDQSYWNGGGPLAIGFKFGTGNTADEWFIYSLVYGVYEGTYEFFPILAPGGETIGRLSHVFVYTAPGDDDDDDDDTDLPEPGTLGLLGLGLLGVGMTRRHKI
jgi:hypothetical protein